MQILLLGYRDNMRVEVETGIAVTAKTVAGAPVKARRISSQRAAFMSALPPAGLRSVRQPFLSAGAPTKRELKMLVKRH
jgi:hypothetical protein